MFLHVGRFCGPQKPNIARQERGDPAPAVLFCAVYRTDSFLRRQIVLTGAGEGLCRQKTGVKPGSLPFLKWGGVKNSKKALFLWISKNEYGKCRK